LHLVTKGQPSKAFAEIFEGGRVIMEREKRYECDEQNDKDGTEKVRMKGLQEMNK
jgi:hypothetical protein